MSSAEPVLLDIGDPAQISDARAEVRRATTDLDPEVALSAELVASELMTNALLHGGGSGQLRLTYLDSGGLRIAVADRERRAPIVGVSSESSMTGRGLAMIGRLSSAWGVLPLLEGGKEVWATVEPGRGEERGADELLDAWDDDDDAAWAIPEDRRFTVALGEVPTDLLIRAKSHIDNLVREFMLASSGASTGTTESVPANLAELIRTVVHNFVDAREAIKRQAVDAYNHGRDHTHLVLRLPAEAADAGEAYLAALDEVDQYCRAERLLTLETPPEQRLFRQWYVGELVGQVRAAARGDEVPPATTFEQRLVDEVASVAVAHRRAEGAARLYEVSIALTEVTTPEAVARVVLDLGSAGLGASGVAVLLPGDADHLTVAGSVGYDHAIVEQLGHEARDADLPAAYALRTGEAVWIESPDDLDARFPQLRGFEPGAVSMCAVPFGVGGRRLGVLRLSFVEPRLFDEDERRFLVALGAQCALAIERTHLERARAQERPGVSGSDAVASLEELFEALPALVAYLEGPDHIFRFVNRSYQQVLAGRELIGRTVAEALPEATQFGLEVVADRVWETGQAVTGREVLIRIPSIDGTMAERFADFTFQPIRRSDGALEGVLVHAVDVTDDVRARQALVDAAAEIRQLELQAQEDRFRQAVDGMLDPVIMCRPVLDETGAVVDLRVEYANAAADQGDAETASSVGRLLSEAWAGIREAGLLERYVTVAATGQPLVLDEYPYDEGGVFDIRATKVGDTVFIVYRDVTGRAEREAEVQHHRKALAEAQRIARIGSWQWDDAGRLRWSEEFYDICGFDRSVDEPSRDGFLELLDDADRDALWTAIGAAAADGGRFQLELRIRRRDGEERSLIVTGEAAKGGDGSLSTTRGTVQDITEQRRIEQELRRSEERRQEEHDAVQILQAAILPNELPEIPGASVVARYVAASENVAVGGDFYDVFVLDDERVLLTVGDVAGKGVQAAEAVGQLRNGLRMAAVLDPDPMAMVAALNALVARGFKAPFATAVVAVYRPAAGRLDWASAGHLPLVVRRASGACELVGVDPTHPPIGVSGQELAPPASLTLAPGDAVLLFTDGLIERRGEDLGDSLDELVRAVADGPLDVSGLVVSVLGRSVGTGPRQDDVCVLALTRSERRSRPDRGWS